MLRIVKDVKGSLTTIRLIGRAHTITLNTCHVAMLDMPFRVAAVIADAARGE